MNTPQIGAMHNYARRRRVINQLEEHEERHQLVTDGAFTHADSDNKMFQLRTEKPINIFIIIL